MPEADSAPPVAVCVPLRDERLRLPALLQALSRQRGVAPETLAVCLLFDGCRDGSEAVAREAAARLPLRIFTRALPRMPEPNAGRARRAAMGLGQEITGGDPGALLLTTDADSLPAADWVARSVAALAEVDLVAGHILRRNRRRLPERLRLEGYLERLHRLRRTIDPISYDPAPSHPSIGGASLGFRASVYGALGGFATSASGEDVQIVAAARFAGFRVRHDRAVRVITSARRHGRAAQGLAAELLQAWRSSAPTWVEHPDDAAALFVRHAAARRAFEPGLMALHESRRRGFAAGLPEAMLRLGALLNQPPIQVARTALTAPNAEAFAMRVVPRADCRRRLPLPEAEDCLHGLEARYRSESP